MTCFKTGFFLKISSAVLVGIMLLIQPIRLQAQDDPEEARDRLEEISEERAVVERELSNASHAESLALNELEEIDSELSYIQRRLEETTQSLQRKRDQVAFLSQSHNQALEDLAESQARFETRLVEWYKSGGSTVFSSLITTGDLSDFLDVIYYTNAIIKSDRETIQFIKDQQGQIFMQREQLLSETDELENLLAEMRANEEEYANLRSRRSSRLSELASDVNELERALAELEASSYEIAMLLQVSHYTGVSGPLIRPVDANVTSAFGMRRHPILGSVRMHTGVDMPCPAGTPIHAAGTGLVVYSAWKRGYGNMVIIDHGSGLATAYAHCSALLVSLGETVSRGQVIARVGSTGLSTGNHLHFEVRINGEPTDPVPYISGN